MKYHFCLINKHNHKYNHEKTLENLKFKVIKTITECNLWKFSCDEKKKKQKKHTQKETISRLREIDKRRK